MRQKRAKAYKKLMAMYELRFGFRQPYQVLVDSEMCTTVQDHKIDLVKQLETVLQGSVKPMITQCCMVELYKLGKERQPAVDIAKEFERRKCNHREAIDGPSCIESVVGDKNKHRYIIASQEGGLRVKLRKIPGVPLIHIKMSVMVIEPPSDETLRIKNESEEGALHTLETEKSGLPSQEVSPSVLVKPHRKAKGPNPLSMKKKAPKGPNPHSNSFKLAESNELSATSVQKRKRELEDDSTDPNLGPKKKKRHRKKLQESVQE